MTVEPKRPIEVLYLALVPGPNGPRFETVIRDADGASYVLLGGEVQIVEPGSRALPSRGCCQAGAVAFPGPCPWHPPTPTDTPSAPS